MYPVAAAALVCLEFLYVCVGGAQKTQTWVVESLITASTDKETEERGFRWEHPDSIFEGSIK